MRRQSKWRDSISFFYMLTAGILLLSACEKTGQGGRNAGTDEQIGADFEYQYIAESEEGYYFWEPMTESQFYPRLMFMDKESGRVVPLCNKPDCPHEGEECNAYYPKMTLGEDGIDRIDRYYLQYYEGNLYAVGFSSDGYAALFRIKGDGSEWEISTKLYRTDYASTNIWESPSVLINNGYVYFIDNKQTNMELERIPVGGGTAETVYEGDSHATFTDVHRLEGHDGAVFFQAVSFFDETSDYRSGALYRYDTASGQCRLIKEGIYGPYSVQNDFVYYGSGEGLCRYSIQEDTTEILSEASMDVPNITLTQDYIILCDQRGDGELIFYDYEGTKITSVSDEWEPRWYYGGNSRMLFAECWGGSYSAPCCLDLTCPLEQLQWKELKAD